MSASLVGSEMCIRDSLRLLSARAPGARACPHHAFGPFARAALCSSACARVAPCQLLLACSCGRPHRRAPWAVGAPL
eukprot:4373643-Alexandrium_andersonii.AAC.1